MAIVFLVLAIDTACCAGTVLSAFFAETVRVSRRELPDTTWQTAWKIWFVLTVVAWIGAILLQAGLADARKSASRRSDEKPVR